MDGRPVFLFTDGEQHAVDAFFGAWAGIEIVAEKLMQAVEATLRDVTKLRGEVHFVATGSLPNDGKAAMYDLPGSDATSCR